MLVRVLVNRKNGKKNCGKKYLYIHVYIDNG